MLRRERARETVRRSAAVLLGAVCGLLAGCARPADEATLGPGVTGTIVGPTTVSEATTVAFLGDSYTEGVGSSDGAGYVSSTAHALGIVPIVFAEGGTGYVNPGDDPGESTYGERVAAVVAAKPDVVVVQGGTNDHAAPAERIADAASAVFAGLRAGLPDAVLVVLGPVNPPDLPREAVREVDAALAAAAEASDAVYIDALGEGWLEPADVHFGVGDTHPNDRGYSELADRLVADLEALLPTD
ncbi:SGNH/GDSL hydrolase family protein [Modestobacter sp. SYSU DS0657]